MKKLVASFLIFILIAPAAALAQTDKGSADFTAAFDAYIQKSMQMIGDVPGVAVVVIKDDRPIFTKAYGMADREAGKAAETDTLFYMGSTTKSFTALVAAMLDREGKIRLADPVTKYTRGVEFKTPLPDKVTVRDLLTHTSGLNNPALVHRTAFTGEIDRADIARVFAETRIDEANYGKYRYTNLGYNIYGLLMENKLKKKWQDELQKRIFGPMGLSHSTAYRTTALKNRYSIAAPYIFDEAQGRLVRSPVDKVDSNMQAAGGHFMSIVDLGKWLNMNLNGGKLNGKQVIPADLLDVVHTGYTKSTRNEPPFSGDGEYGLGWQIGKYGSERAIYHHGGYPGYRSHVSYMPDKRIAVGILVNNDHVGGRLADLLAVYAYDYWLGKADLDAAYAKNIQDFANQYTGRKQQIAGGVAERAKRVSQLTEPLANYVGKYVDPLLGTIDVKVEGATLAFRMGRLYAVGTPYTEKETIRVVMIPGGNGEVIGFAKGASGQVEILKYAGRDFKRVAP